MSKMYDQASITLLQDEMLEMLNTFGEKSNTFGEKSNTFGEKSNAFGEKSTASKKTSLSSQQNTSTNSKSLNVLLDYNSQVDEEHYSTINDSNHYYQQQNIKIDLSFLPGKDIQSYRHLHTNLSQKATNFNEKLEAFAQTWTSSIANIEWDYPSLPNSSPIYCYGRLFSDTEDVKWNDKSVLLELSRGLGSGSKIPFRLNELSSFSFFPGQIVAAKGLAVSDGFHVQELLNYVPLKPPLSPLSTLQTFNFSSPLKMIVAQGPFCRLGSPSSEPLDLSFLQRLFSHCISSSANVLVLLGPFIPSEDFSDYASQDELFTSEKIFKSQVSPCLNAFVHSFPSIKLLLVPSLKDSFHKFVFPQSPFSRQALDLSPDIVLLPNPSFFYINEFIVFISTLDILFDLSCQELSRNTSVSTQDRMSRLVKHLFEQRSLYPLFPPGTQSNIDYNYYSKLELPILPDLLVIPSQLRYFIKNVDSVLCLNPGQLLKGNSMGCFSQVSIFPLHLKDLEGKNIQCLPNLLQKRATVKILEFT